MNCKRSILLINPHIEDFAAYDHFSKPLGLIWLASYLKEHFTLHFVNALNRLHSSLPKMRFKEGGTGDFQKIEIEKPALLKDIPRRFKRYGLSGLSFTNELKSLPEPPDYVFITSGMTYWYTGLEYTISLVKDVYPDSKIFLGGIYASLLPEHAAKRKGADFINPFQDMDKTLGFLENILQVKFSRGYKPPSYDLLGEYYYAPLMTSSGCVFNCKYCASSYLSEFRQFPADMITDEIIHLNNDFSVENFAFYDDALLVNSLSHIDRILEGFLERRGGNVSFYTPNGLHIRYLTEKTARLMKESGFKDIRLSLESYDPGFNSIEGDKARMDEFRLAMEILYYAGFERKNIKAYSLLNVPGQSFKSVEKTMEAVYSAGALPMLAFYSPIPHTPDFKKAMQISGVNEPLFQNNNVYLYRNGFDIEHLNYLKQMELRYRKEEI